MQTSLALFDRVFEYLDLPVEIDEVENPTSIARSELRGEVVFDSVDFSYEDGQPTLQRRQLHRGGRLARRPRR